MIEKLLEEAKTIQAYIEEKPNLASPDDVQGRLVELMSYLARSGEMLAQAKFLLRREKGGKIAEVVGMWSKELNLSSKVQNTYLDCIAEKEAYLVDKLDRLNASITHQVDALRSVLSYMKEELRQTNMGYGQ